MNIDSLAVGEELGRGQYGITYLATDKKGNKYALKLEYVSDEVAAAYKKKNSWFDRETQFANDVAKLYSDNFMQVYGNKLVKQQLINEQNVQYNYCVKTVYSLVDTTFHDLFHTDSFDHNKYVSALMQYLYINEILKAHKYYIKDRHCGNIGITYTDQEYIEVAKQLQTKLGCRKIPTYGIKVQMIDYGMISMYGDAEYLPLPIYDPYDADFVELLQDSNPVNDAIKKHKMLRLLSDFYVLSLLLSNNKGIYNKVTKVSTNPYVQIFAIQYFFHGINVDTAFNTKLPEAIWPLKTKTASVFNNINDKRKLMLIFADMFA